MTANTPSVQDGQEFDSLLQAILATSSDGIALVDANGDFLEANVAFGRIFGVDPQEVIGKKCVEVLGCEAGRHTYCHELCMAQKVLEQGQSQPSVEMNLSIQGTFRSVNLSITPVATANMPVCLIIAQDVTPIRDATRIKTNFISMITHELRSPLNAIHGYLDLVLTGAGGELNEQQRDFIRRARAGSEHLYALLENLLLIARADAGQWRLNRNIMNLPDGIRDAVEELELTAADNDITLTVDVADTLPPIYADAVRIQQVVRNLLSNALHFTPVGGQVTLGARIEPNTYEDISSEYERVVILQVSDTGCGILLDEQQRIFERFYQVPDAATSPARGLGLGLAVVKMIVELHGGKVLLTSAPGQGSTFICVLPCLLS